MKNGSKFPQTNIRMPPDLKDFLKQEAEKNQRSLGAEIVFRLQESCNKKINSPRCGM